MPIKIAKSALRERANPARRSPLLKLEVQYASTSRNVPSQASFSRWVRSALRSSAQITVRLVGLQEGRELNRTYRGRDYATNVLTFILHDRAPYAGDLALCTPVVTREARAQRKDVTAHYAHLIVHAVLHLQGWQHDLHSDAVAMEKLEACILKRMGYPDPYAATLPYG